MSSGGLLQLVAYGAQDIYLTNNPQITFFQMVYRRHTNFSMDSMAQTFNGTVDFGRKATVSVARNGDLIYRTYLELELPALARVNNAGTVTWTRNIGQVILDEFYIDIGGSTIDKHYGIWLSIWNELTQTAEKEDTYLAMIGSTTTLTPTNPGSTIPAATVYVPLIFWFNRNPGLALPLIALMYHEVKFTFQFRPASQCIITNDGNPTDGGWPSLQGATLYIDYIFLDAEERRSFARNKHEYLIEQLQFTGGESFNNSSIRQKLNFSHPCKELIWALQLDSNVDNGANRWIDFTDGSTAYAGNSVVDTAKIQLNTTDRISLRQGDYFNRIQPYWHHTRCPATGIYVYSFALKPEEHQPSGSINMSRIESTTLVLNVNTGTSPLTVYTFATNYNVLRISSGINKHQCRKVSCSSSAGSSVGKTICDPVSSFGTVVQTLVNPV